MFEKIIHISSLPLMLALLLIGGFIAAAGVWLGSRRAAPILVVTGAATVGVAISQLLFWVIPFRDLSYGTPLGAPALLFGGIGMLAISFSARSIVPRSVSAGAHILSIGLVIGSLFILGARELNFAEPTISVFSLLVAIAVSSILVFVCRSGIFPSARSASAFEPMQVGQMPASPLMTSPNAADVFISYKREERARVEQIAQALRELKLSVWFDARLQSGHSFDAEINREVRAAKCVLVCWSPGAVESEWVRAEAAIGRQRGVLAACFLEPCDLYPPFNLVHAEDLSQGMLDASNPAWTKLVDQIGRYAGRLGLGAYLQLGADRAAQGLWLAENPNDPLAEVLLARLRQT